jgi:AcrR family transcriptional regulator
VSLSIDHAAIERARRAPVQERSQETVNRVLAAATTLLGEGVAPDALTTAHIAARAGLSVGALYRFFPDKQAIVDAIAHAHMERFGQAVMVQMMGGLPDGPAVFLGTVIDGFVAYLAANPDFRTLAYGGPAGGRFISRQAHEAEAGAGAVAVMVREFAVEAFDLPDGPDLDFRLRIATEIGDRLIGHAFAQPDAAARDRVVAEAKRLLAGYLFGG